MGYRYVGDASIAAAAGTGPGRALRSPAQFREWATDNAAEPCTYVVAADGVLLVAPRHTEHVACASGREVLAAGEITFAADDPGGDGDWRVEEVSNQSTGYCPEPSCWPVVAAAVERLGVRHPGGFTAAFEFRRCGECGSLSVVKENDFTCAVCESPLPAEWNLADR